MEPDESIQSINLIGTVYRGSDALVGMARRGYRLGIRQRGKASCDHCGREATDHDAGGPHRISPLVAAAFEARADADWVPSVTVSGSGRKSTILNPNGFQRRVAGSP